MTAGNWLPEAAAIAFAEAPRRCTVIPSRGRSCVSIHRLWPALRMLGLAASAELHAEFLISGVRSALERIEHVPRILISGASDHALLAIVLDALGDTPERADIMVADRCETPLLLNRWYARKLGRHIETTRTDVLALREPGAFDLVCTHSFLGFFAPAERERLVEHWLSLLRPGGRFITANRIRAARAGGSGDRDAEELEREVLRRARSIEGALPASAVEIAALARQRVSAGQPFPVRSLDEMRALFERAGFEIERLGEEKLAPALQSGVWAPGVPGDAPYALLIARKPAAD